MMLTVDLINEIDNDDFPTQQQFQTWVNETLIISKKVWPAACQHVCILIIDKIKSAELNETYRKKKGPTNVLSFMYHSAPGFEQNSLGDLAICAELVKEEAKDQQKSIVVHWAHLTIHGVLHLLDYDHEKNSDAEIMEFIEIETLKKLGFNNPYYS